jgi:hypothetical protein
MADESSFNIPAHGAPTPREAALQAFVDVIPPAFPEGVEIIFMRPGQLEPAGRVMLPVGVMLLLAPPETAVHLRAAQRAQIEQQRRMLANGLGHRGP